MYQMIKLRQLGVSALILEMGSDVGGTWYWNRYPGARFDSESYSYGMSFSKELLQEWEWSEHFSSQPETLRYCQYIADKFDLKNPNLIIDGNFSLNYKSYKEQSIIKGVNKSLSIAAASIIAKVHRDRLMKKLSIKFQDFGWEKNSGYGTKKHIENIHRFGPTIHHRKTFEPIKSLIHN